MHGLSEQGVSEDMITACKCSKGVNSEKGGAFG